MTEDQGTTLIVLVAVILGVLISRLIADINDLGAGGGR